MDGTGNNYCEEGNQDPERQMKHSLSHIRILSLNL